MCVCECVQERNMIASGWMGGEERVGICVLVIILQLVMVVARRKLDV